MYIYLYRNFIGNAWKIVEECGQSLLKYHAHTKAKIILKICREGAAEEAQYIYIYIYISKAGIKSIIKTQFERIRKTKIKEKPLLDRGNSKSRDPRHADHDTQKNLRIPKNAVEACRTELKRILREKKKKRQN